MQVHCNEGVASHIGPESCAYGREGVCEALTGDRIGLAIEPRKLLSRVPTLCDRRKATRTGASSRVPARPGVVEDPWHVRTLLVRELGDLTVGQRRCAVRCSGPHREGEEP